MPRSKLQKFKALNNLPNVVQINQGDIELKLQKFIKKNKRLTLELGCGRADYTLALARQNPDQLFIGTDIQGERLWYGAHRALTEKLNNILFLRLPLEKLAEYFSAHTIAEIWLTFPDPYPKKKHIKKRLTAPYFQKMFCQLLCRQGQVHLKTDDAALFHYSITQIKATGTSITKKIVDLYRTTAIPFPLSIQTHFEKKHLAQGKKIYYLCWQYKLDKL